LNASPLGMGLLTNQGPPPWHPGGEEVKAACRAAAELCRVRGADISVLGMQFCAVEPGIPSTITGAATVNELRTNLRALAEPIDAELLADVQAVLAPVRNRTWANGNWPTG
jgi:L-galactose dehydrogenase